MIDVPALIRAGHYRSADLRYANLRSANLDSADLRGADLRYANLRGARVNERTLWPAGFDAAAAGVVGVER